MGMQTMGSQGDDNNNGKQSQLELLPRQNSMYGLTLDEVQSQLGDLGKPLSSMNLDELLKNVLSAEASQSMGTETDGAPLASQASLPRQGSLSLTGVLSKKTVDEVWRDIQQSKDTGEKKSKERQPTLGEMTLEDFLVKAGIVAEVSLDKRDSSAVVGINTNAALQFPQHSQWMQYPHLQYQHQQQSMMGVYMPGPPIPPAPIPPPPHMMDVSFLESQVPLPSTLVGSSSDTQAPARKRGMPEDVIEKSVERRHKRMIKNRESAARSRARKQAYTNELENKVSRLEEENESLRKRKELEKMLPSVLPPEPKYQLRRTSSAPF
uniref:ABSCISIC ACID-INSENSITIVE 5-like protein 2 n=1 Tax=Rhizophora mucronata TaxID=61149 RepID=A0A2P2JS57_RHIMU